MNPKMIVPYGLTTFREAIFVPDGKIDAQTPTYSGSDFSKYLRLRDEHSSHRIHLARVMVLPPQETAYGILAALTFGMAGTLNPSFSQVFELAIGTAMGRAKELGMPFYGLEIMCQDLEKAQSPKTGATAIYATANFYQFFDKV